MSAAAFPGERRGATATRRRTQLPGRIAAMLALSLGLALVLPITSASARVAAREASACSLLDPSCVVQPVADDTVKLGGAADGAAKEVGDGLEDAAGAVDQVLGSARGIGGSPHPGTGGGARGGGGSPGGGGYVQGHRGAHRGAHRGSHRASDRRRVDAAHGARPALARRTGGPTRRVDASAVTVEAPGRPAGPEAQAGANAGAAAARIAAEIGLRVAIPLVLLLVIVLTFVAVQARIDRDDPKLRLAAVDDEFLPFR